jgi:CHAD domain-containing protein
MVSVLRSERTRRLLSQWNVFLEQLVSLPVEDRPDAARAIGLLAGERIRKVYVQMTRMGRPLSESSAASDFHELRKKGKELRYLLELFGLPVYPTEVVRPMIKTLRALQDVLGRHQDREVQITTLHALSEEVASQPGGAAALMAMGVLLDRLAADAQQARGAFAERFAAFASKSQRRLVKATFA